MKYIIAAVLSAILFCTIPQPHTNNQLQVAKAKQVSKVAREVQPSVPGQQKQEQAPVVETSQPITPVQMAQAKAAAYGWVGSEWEALYDLWQRESGWNPNAYNTSSGACGLPQALPCSKIPNPEDVASQIDWGLAYIHNRYTTPSKALNFWHYGAPNYNGSNWY